MEAACLPDNVWNLETSVVTNIAREKLAGVSQSLDVLTTRD